MALHYQTEYRVGARRVHRSYCGYQAFVASVFDLIFGLFFELVASLIGLSFRLARFAIRFLAQVFKGSWRVMVSVMAALVFTMTLPFVILHRAIARFAPSARFWPREGFARSAQKPDWAFSREV
jgi:hypothetical protein